MRPARSKVAGEGDFWFGGFKLFQIACFRRCVRMFRGRVMRSGVMLRA